MSEDMLGQARDLLTLATNAIDHCPSAAPAMAQAAQAAAVIALTEQAKRIADALGSIDTVLCNASGPGGAIKIAEGH